MRAAAKTRAPLIADRPVGEPGAWVGELFREHARTVYGLCAVLLRNSHEAEDAAQQAFVSAYESLRGGAAPEKPDAWLLTIARNECLDRLRRRTRWPAAPLLDRDLPSESVEEIAARHAALDELRAALAELPANQRDAIVLHELCGLAYGEIAQVLGVSLPAVESLLFRGRQRLKDRAGSLRVLAGLLVLPVGLREGLANAIPSFPAVASSEVAGGGGAAGTAQGAAGGVNGAAGGAAGGSASLSGGTFGMLSVKLASLPLVAKVAATAVVVAGAASAVVHEVGSTPARTPLALEFSTVAPGVTEPLSLESEGSPPETAGEPLPQTAELPSDTPPPAEQGHVADGARLVGPEPDEPSSDVATGDPELADPPKAEPDPLTEPAPSESQAEPPGSSEGTAESGGPVADDPLPSVSPPGSNQDPGEPGGGGGTDPPGDDGSGDDVPPPSNDDPPPGDGNPPPTDDPPPADDDQPPPDDDPPPPDDDPPPPDDDPPPPDDDPPPPDDDPPAGDDDDGPPNGGGHGHGWWWWFWWWWNHRP